MTDLFEVQAFGHIAITYHNNGAVVASIAFLEEDDDPEELLIDRTVYTTPEEIALFVETYSRRMLEKPSASLERSMRQRKP